MDKPRSSADWIASKGISAHDASISIGSDLSDSLRMHLPSGGIQYRQAVIGVTARGDGSGALDYGLSHHRLPISGSLGSDGRVALGGSPLVGLVGGSILWMEDGVRVREVHVLGENVYQDLSIPVHAESYTEVRIDPLKGQHEVTIVPKAELRAWRENGGEEVEVFTPLGRKTYRERAYEEVEYDVYGPWQMINGLEREDRTLTREVFTDRYEARNELGEMYFDELTNSGKSDDQMDRSDDPLSSDKILTVEESLQELSEMSLVAGAEQLPIDGVIDSEAGMRLTEAEEVRSYLSSVYGDTLSHEKIDNIIAMDPAVGRLTRLSANPVEACYGDEEDQFSVMKSLEEADARPEAGGSSYSSMTAPQSIGFQQASALNQSATQLGASLLEESGAGVMAHGLHTVAGVAQDPGLAIAGHAIGSVLALNDAIEQGDSASYMETSARLASSLTQQTAVGMTHSAISGVNSVANFNDALDEGDYTSALHGLSTVAQLSGTALTASGFTAAGGAFSTAAGAMGSAIPAVSVGASLADGNAEGAMISAVTMANPVVGIGLSVASGLLGSPPPPPPPRAEATMVLNEWGRYEVTEASHKHGGNGGEMARVAQQTSDLVADILDRVGGRLLDPTALEPVTLGYKGETIRVNGQTVYGPESAVDDEGGEPELGTMQDAIALIVRDALQASLIEGGDPILTRALYRQLQAEATLDQLADTLEIAGAYSAALHGLEQFDSLSKSDQARITRAITAGEELGLDQPHPHENRSRLNDALADASVDLEGVRIEDLILEQVEGGRLRVRVAGGDPAQHADTDIWTRDVDAAVVHLPDQGTFSLPMLMDIADVHAGAGRVQIREALAARYETDDPSALAVGWGRDAVVGDTGDNTLIGIGGNNVLVGVAGDNQFISEGGNQLKGGEGEDTADYSRSTEGIVVDLAEGVGTAGDATGDTYVDIEHVIGSMQDDVLIGNEEDNQLVGLDGRNTLVGVAGDNTLIGGSGDDILVGGSGNDILHAGAGDNRLEAGSGDNLLRGGAGNDILIGGQNNDVLLGGNGQSVLHGGGGTNILRGSSADSIIHASGRGDHVDGGGGTNTVVYNGQAADFVLGTDGVDLFVRASAGSSADTLHNVDTIQFDDQTLRVAEVRRHVAALSEPDEERRHQRLTGMPAAGATGWADAAAIGVAAVVVTAFDSKAAQADGNTAASAIGQLNTARASIVDVAMDPSDRNDSKESVVIADDVPVLFDAISDDGAYESVFRQGVGTAPEFSSPGEQDGAFLDAGVREPEKAAAGSDDSSNGAEEKVVKPNTDATRSLVETSDSGRYALYGTDGSDILIDERGYNLIYGLGGDDVIDGVSGRNYIFTGDGNNRVIASPGGDTVYGGSGQDTMTYERSDEGVTARLDGKSGSSGYADEDRLHNIEVLVGSTFDDVLIGSNYAHTLSGNAGSNTYTGGAGDTHILVTAADRARNIDGGGGVNIVEFAADADWQVDLGAMRNIDWVISGDGNNTFLAGADSHVIHAGNGSNTVSYHHSTDAVYVDIAIGRGLNGYAAGDRYDGIDTVIGSLHDDVLIGHDKEHTLKGNAGSNQYLGGTGNTTILAGVGDVFHGVDGGGGSNTLQYVDDLYWRGDLSHTRNINRVIGSAAGFDLGLDWGAGVEHIEGIGGRTSVSLAASVFDLSFDWGDQHQVTIREGEDALTLTGVDELVLEDGITIYLDGRNNAPLVESLPELRTDENTAQVIHPTDILAGVVDVDPDDEVHIHSVQSHDGRGTVRQTESGYAFTPRDNFFDPNVLARTDLQNGYSEDAEITITFIDQHGTQTTTTTQIAIDWVNEPPRINSSLIDYDGNINVQRIQSSHSPPEGNYHAYQYAYGTGYGQIQAHDREENGDRLITNGEGLTFTLLEAPKYGQFSLDRNTGKFSWKLNVEEDSSYFARVRYEVPDPREFQTSSDIVLLKPGDVVASRDVRQIDFTVRVEDSMGASTTKTVVLDNDGRSPRIEPDINAANFTKLEFLTQAEYREAYDANRVDFPARPGSFTVDPDDVVEDTSRIIQNMAAMAAAEIDDIPYLAGCGCADSIAANEYVAEAESLAG